MEEVGKVAPIAHASFGYYPRVQKLGFSLFDLERAPGRIQPDLESQHSFQTHSFKHTIEVITAFTTALSVSIAMGSWLPSGFSKLGATTSPKFVALQVRIFSIFYRKINTARRYLPHLV